MALNSLFIGRVKHIHLVGIGGIGMSGIAHVLLAAGFRVSGSDISDNEEIQRLRTLGARIEVGHEASHVHNADVLVYSSAIPPHNPELLKAHDLRIPVIPRALMLAELMRLKCGIAIAGAHGKTTTTSLIGTMMKSAGLDPTVVIGGRVNQLNSNAHLGQGQFMVAEADESDGSFLHLSPTIAVLTNIDEEHLDFYAGGLGELKESFLSFFNALPFYGLMVACLDDPHVRSLLPGISKRISTYGFHEHALFQAQEVLLDRFHSSFTFVYNGRKQARVQLQIMGRHNIQNALAALAVLHELDVPLSTILESLEGFQGVARRFSVIGRPNDIYVIDDYAHHPAEIQAVLKGTKESFPSHRIHVLFQPHRYSRTAQLFEQFAQAFAFCDSLHVVDIYGAQENPLAHITSAHLVERIQKQSQKNAHYVPNMYEGAQAVAKLARPEDIILTLGAGSITRAAPYIVSLLKPLAEHHAAAA